MAKGEIGKLTFNIQPEALREIISSGRLTEFASKAAAHAAFQVNAQVVDLVSKAALDKGTIANGISVSFSTVFEDGDFGVGGGHGPIPHLGVVIGDSPLTQVVTVRATQESS